MASPLDPADWDNFSTVAHTFLDEILARISGKRDVRWRPVPENVHQRFLELLPERPQTLGEITADLDDLVFPYPRGNASVNYYAYIDGPGTAISFLGEMIAAGLNPNCTGLDQAATYVESQTIRWIAQMLGLPSETSGLFVSGATSANLIGLACARSASLSNCNADGLWHSSPLVFYASSEVHKWASKALQILGIGSKQLRSVDVLDDFRIDTAHLKRCIEHDLEAGATPSCVIGSAGTVNTGAVDDLLALREIANRYGLWFHVDGALGAIAKVSARYRPLVDGIETADSLALDLHKWGGQCYEAGVALVANTARHVAAFATAPEAAPYLSAANFAIAEVKETNALPRDPHPYTLLGIDQSRSFKALKVWLSMKYFGAAQLEKAIDRTCDLARYLADLVRADDRFELCAPVPLNIVCFRYRFADEQSQQALTFAMLSKLQLDGVATMSTTMLNGKIAMRVAIVNARSTEKQFDQLISAIACAAQEFDDKRKANAGSAL